MTIDPSITKCIGASACKGGDQYRSHRAQVVHLQSQYPIQTASRDAYTHHRKRREEKKTNKNIELDRAPDELWGYREYPVTVFRYSKKPDAALQPENDGGSLAWVSDRKTKYACLDFTRNAEPTAVKDFPSPFTSLEDEPPVMRECEKYAMQKSVKTPKCCKCGMM